MVKGLTSLSRGGSRALHEGPGAPSPVLPASPRKQGAGLGPPPPPSLASQPLPTSPSVSTESTGSPQPAPGPPGIVSHNLISTLAFVTLISQLRSPQLRL